MRLFVGVPIPPEAQLHATGADLAARVEGARPVPPGTHHVTLRFLGEVARAEPVAEALGAASQGLALGEATTTGLGAFPQPRKARILWAGVSCDGLQGLRDRVVEATRDVGQAEADRPFQAHATLARVDPPADATRALAETPLPPWRGRLPHVVLYRSVLGPAGPSYEPLATVPLGQA